MILAKDSQVMISNKLFSDTKPLEQMIREILGLCNMMNPIQDVTWLVTLLSKQGHNNSLAMILQKKICHGGPFCFSKGGENF